MTLHKPIREKDLKCECKAEQLVPYQNGRIYQMDFPLGSVLGPVPFHIFTTDPNGRSENKLITLRDK